MSKDLIAEAETLQAEYNTATRSPTTGKLYQPSHKWGGWDIVDGTRHSLGASGDTFDSISITAANRVKELRGRARCAIFKRGNPCKIKALVYWQGTPEVGHIHMTTFN